jgi:MoxR-like ATPase
VKEEIARIQHSMAEQGYITDRATATAAYLAITLRKPLLIEGPPGVGKTEVAKVLARVLDTKPGSMMGRHRWQRRQLVYAVVAFVAVLAVVTIDAVALLT